MKGTRRLFPPETQKPTRPLSYSEWVLFWTYQQEGAAIPRFGQIKGRIVLMGFSYENARANGLKVTVWPQTPRSGDSRLGVISPVTRAIGITDIAMSAAATA